MKQINIGRNPDNDLVLNDDLSVSRIHASIFIEGNSKFIVDHNSSNGTFVNGNKIMGKTILHDYDIVKVGNTPVQWMQMLEMPKESNANARTISVENKPQFTNSTTQLGNESLPGSGAALTLGILSIVFTGIVGLILGIIGISQANKGKRLIEVNQNNYTNGSIKNSKAGMVCSIIGLTFSSLVILFYLMFIASIL
ncbi:MAG: FHA domain-containing protein [Flavobacteriia bacterium]|jgi:hypothetical protein